MNGSPNNVVLLYGDKGEQKEEFQRRVSHVFILSEFPKGTRKRGWGYLHDQIWFYVPDGQGPMLAGRMWGSADGLHIVCEPHVPFVDDVGKHWRRHEGKWMRLYMDRKMIWFGKPRGTIRLHTFYSGDDVSAPHDHPWWFVTFPLSNYIEEVEVPYGEQQPFDLIDWNVRLAAGRTWLRVTRTVRRFHFHFRSAKYRHVVHEPARPFKTLVITGGVTNEWGFWPDPGKFISHKANTSYGTEKSA